MEGRIESENEYAYVDEFPFVPRTPHPAVENTLNHRKDCAAGGAAGGVYPLTAACSSYPGGGGGGEGAYTSTHLTTRADAAGMYVHNSPNQGLHNRSQSLGSPGDVGFGDPPKYFTLDPDVAPRSHVPSSCLPANIPVKLGAGCHGNNNDVIPMDNRYEVQEAFPPRRMLTFKADPNV